MKTNYHSHSLFCDGKNTMEEMLVAAIEKGFTHWGFSAHAPVPFENNFAIKREDVPSYMEEYRRLKEKYVGKINLYAGMEMDFITDIQENIQEQASEYGLDYLIGSVHQVKEHNESSESWFIDGKNPEIYDEGLKKFFNADIRRAVRTYFEQQIHMLEKNRVDVIAHCDKITMHNRERYFSVEDKWYQDLLWDLFNVMIKHGVICEINTRGLYKKRHNDYYPSKRFWKELNAKGLKFILASDCHQRDETDFYFDEAKDILRSAGVRSLCYFEDSWKEYAI